MGGAPLAAQHSASSNPEWPLLLIPQRSRWRRRCCALAAVWKRPRVGRAAWMRVASVVPADCCSHPLRSVPPMPSLCLQRAQSRGGTHQPDLVLAEIAVGVCCIWNSVGVIGPAGVAHMCDAGGFPNCTQNCRIPSAGRQAHADWACSCASGQCNEATLARPYCT